MYRVKRPRAIGRWVHMGALALLLLVVCAALVTAAGLAYPPFDVKVDTPFVDEGGHQVVKLRFVQAGTERGKLPTTECRDALLQRAPGGDSAKLDEEWGKPSSPTKGGYRVAFADPGDCLQGVPASAKLAAVYFPPASWDQVLAVFEKPLSAPVEARLVLLPGTEPKAITIPALQVVGTNDLLEALKQKGAEASIDPASKALDVVYKPQTTAHLLVHYAKTTSLDTPGRAIKNSVETYSDHRLTLAPVFEFYVNPGKTITYWEEDASGELHVRLNDAGKESRDSIQAAWERRYAWFRPRKHTGTEAGNQTPPEVTPVDCLAVGVGMESDQDFETANGTIKVRWTRSPHVAKGLDVWSGFDLVGKITGDQDDFQPRATFEAKWKPDLGGLSDALAFSARERFWYNPEGGPRTPNQAEVELQWFLLSKDYPFFVRYVNGSEPPDFNYVSQVYWGIAWTK